MKASYGALVLTDLPHPPAGKTGWPWTKASKLPMAYMPDGSEWPRISVITPSYNQGQFLEETIRSVLLQGYPNLEYIVIDGGSTDHSVEILQKYSPYINYWVSELDNGQSHALNKGLKLSTGSILGWLNSDDLYVKGALKKIAISLCKSKSFILVHGNRILLNEDSQVIGYSPRTSFNPDKTQYNICSETVFWRRSAIEHSGLFKESLIFAMDLEFFSRLYSYGDFLKLNDYLGYFRCYKSNKSSTIPCVGLEEASKEWKIIFGTEYVAKRNLMVENRPNKITLLKALITNPRLIGFPYILYKISKFV